MSNYWRYSRSAYYSVLMALPLLLAYEVLIVLTKSEFWENAVDRVLKVVPLLKSMQNEE